ncbi:autotransporter outer membrane beta-barrel domain-containing protein [Enterobacter sp. 638]|uniref:Outer membrane autotransporter barrel domain n=1 Tax=Enterobacter sp. (strain 638) TaxID=399742 RepID=A0A9J9GJU6_ENT38|nr:autotransporter outer membrane beta-barrel domain-containing protein [Enterobacter sp. 638]ABP62811.1 outer membrane autotransporter barrel domain [Enterobacter sp. 638]
MKSRNKCVFMLHAEPIVLTKMKPLSILIASLLGIAVFPMLPVSKVIASECMTANGTSNGASVSSGGTCSFTSGYTPVINDNQVDGANINSGDTITISGLGTDIISGDRGIQQNSLGTLNSATNGLERLLLGSRTSGVNTLDPVTGSNIVVATYDSNSFASSDWGQYNNVATQTPKNAGDNQYIDARLGTVQNGTMIVSIGDSGQLPSSDVNTINMAAKQTILTLATGINSTIEWNSKNRVLMGDTMVAAAGATTKTIQIEVPVYAGTFKAYDGGTWTVSNANELKVYNNALINALQSGTLSTQAAYDEAFAKAVTFSQKDIDYNYSIYAGDDVTADTGVNYTMYADGAGAKAVLKSGGQIDQRGAGVAVVNGATAIIEEGAQLSGHFNSLFIGSGSNGENNGVISGGYFAEDGWDTTGKGNYFDEYSEAYTVTVDGENSHFNNNGIINVAGWTQYEGYSPDAWGIRVQSNASATNSGIINTGVNNNSLSHSISAVRVANGGKSQFINTSTGEIYLGHAAQYDTANPEAVVDVANALPQYGILLTDGQATNEGKILIGSLTENAVGMAAVASSPTGSLINKGSVLVKGNANSAPLQNVGILALNNGQTQVLNSGTVTLSGVNGIGMKILATSGTATATSDANSAIVVAGGVDPESGTRNYGVWTEGEKAAANIQGDIELSGRGAIGVLARDGAAVVVGSDSAVRFHEVTNPSCTENCSEQIGYLVYGKSSSINNQAEQLEVSSSGSTLFRIEDGATFDSNGKTLTASGKNSTILAASGKGAVVTASSGTLNVSGPGATGVHVDGGATGQIDEKTSINLLGQGSTAGMVDGRKTGLSGVTGTEELKSSLTNNAKIQSAIQDVVGFVAQYGGTVVNNGEISLSSDTNSTGVIVREGGQLINNEAITITKGTGILVDGGASASTLTNQSSISVHDGIAGIHLQNGAKLNALGSGRIITDGTADGILLGTGATGAELGANLITSQGSGSGIHNIQSGTSIILNGTTIVSSSGSAILNDANATFAGSNVTLDSSRGWAIQNNQNQADIRLANSVVSGETGVLLTNPGAITNLDVTSGTLNGRIVTDNAKANVTLKDSSIWNMTADSNVTSLNNDKGSINYTHGGAFNTLTVNGNYAGNDGLLRMSTALGDDNSPTDRLIVEGNTSGSTLVSVTNAGGSGASTINGIELITVKGDSRGVFSQSGRVVAGAYDYSLVRGQAEKDKNWYLTNYVKPVEPTIPIDPTTPVDPTAPVDPVEPTNPAVPVTPTKPSEPVFRPEMGSYSANLAAANNMFVLRLHDRLGETQYTDMLTGENKVTSMWMRHVGGHTRFKDQSGQLNTQSNRYVLQIGGDVTQWSNNGNDRTHLGLMAGYGNEHSNTRSHQSHYRSDGSVNGYSVGAYGTWYANDEDKNGLHVDSWIQYSWFDNTVTGEDIDPEKYKSKGLTASLESGYTFSMGTFKGSQGSTNEWYIQPKAQVIWMGVKADSHKESNGSTVTGEGNGNIQTRAGLRTYIKGHHKMDDGKQREFEPFIEANWIHNTREFGTTMNGVSNKIDGSRNLGEIKTGVEGMINPNLNLWGNVAVQVGDKGYSDTSAMIGVKYSFK